MAIPKTHLDENVSFVLHQNSFSEVFFTTHLHEKIYNCWLTETHVIVTIYL